MATFLADYGIPGLINTPGYVRNGKCPDGEFMKRCVRGTNHIAAFRKKLFYSHGRDLNSIPAGISGDRKFGAGYVWAGYNTSRIQLHVGMIRVAAASLSSCRVAVTVVRLSDSSVQTLYFYNMASAAGHSADTPEKITWLTQGVDLPANNEAYAIAIVEENYARCVSVCAYTVGGNPVNDTHTSIVTQTIGGVGAPILDDEQEDIFEAQTNIWKRNGTVLAWYSFDTTVYEHSSATYTNLIDRSSTSVAATSPGYTIDLRYHAVKSSATVPVRLAVLAQRDSGTGSTGDNRCKFTNGSEALELTGIDGTLEWKVVDGTLPIGTAADKYDLQVRTASGSDSISFYAACILSYE